MKVCMVAYAFYETDNRVRRYAEALAKRGDSVEAVALRRDHGGDGEDTRRERHNYTSRRFGHQPKLGWRVRRVDPRRR